jgi:ribosomal protein L37AE/L43A
MASRFQPLSKEVIVPFSAAAHYQPRCPQCDSNRYHDYGGAYQCDHCGHTGRGPSPVPTDPNQRTLALDSLARQIVDNLLLEDDDTQEQVKAFMKSYTTAHPIGPHPSSADVDEDRMLRAVKVLNKYYLFLWDTYQRREGSWHTYLGYRFVDPKGYILFQGTDYGCPTSISVDSDDAVLELLKWLIIKPGDTDDNYFDNYTPQQLEFANSDDAEQLNMALLGSDGNDDGNDKPWVDLPGYEHGEEDEE